VLKAKRSITIIFCIECKEDKCTYDNLKHKIYNFRIVFDLHIIDKVRKKMIDRVIRSLNLTMWYTFKPRNISIMITGKQAINKIMFTINAVCR